MKNNGIVTLAALCFVALMIWYIIENPNQEKSEPTLEFQLTNTDSTMSTTPTVAYDDYEFSDYIATYSDDYKVFGPYYNDNGDKIVVEIMGENETNLKDLESVKLIYKSFQDTIQLSDVLIQVHGKEYEIVNGLDILKHSLPFITYRIQENFHCIECDSLNNTNVHLDD